MKTNILVLLTAFLLLLSNTLASQQATAADTLNQRVYIDGLPVFTTKDLQPFETLPVLELHESTRQKDLPVVVDNSQLPYFRPIFNQTALECGQAAGVSYLFTYEINRLRDLPSDVAANQYPSHFVFNWSNGGSGYAAPFFDSWNIIKELGTPTVAEYGGSQNTGGVSRWMSGYDLYYQAMQNRLWDFYKIPLNNADDLQVLKHWIDNHAKDEETGGVAVFYASYTGVNKTLPPGTPEAGKYVLTILSSYANHALTVVGYHDSIRYDINNDGQYTNHLDINNDGVVDILDWEIGGVKIANSYSATSWGNEGYAYLLYSALCRPLNIGGVWNRSVHVVNAKENTSPQLTFKATLTHDSREVVKVMAGVANGFDAEQPEYIIEFPVLNYQGGDRYMQGGSSTADKTLEFGLDVTRLLRFLESGQDATFFLLANERDPWNGGTGELNNFSLMDYTDGLVEIACPQTNIPLIENGLTMMSVNANVVFDAPDLLTQALDPAVINEPYEFQMLASGGTAPYQWKIKQQYLHQDGTHTFPNTSAQQLYPNSSTSGFAVKEIDFDFPFYGQSFSKISIHTDGYLMFTEEPYPWTFLVDELVLFKNLRNISPFMCKPLGVGGGGMWYEGDQTKATFRWKAIENSTNNDVNFAVSLYPSGKIEFFYGDITLAHWNGWHAGISDGDDFNYLLHDISNTYNFEPNTMITIEPDYSLTEMKITEDGLFYGLPTQPYEAVDIEFHIRDANGLQGSGTLPFFTDGINKIIIKDVIANAGDDHIIEYGESTTLTVELQNISDEVVTASQMEIITQDQYITLIDNAISLGTFQPGETLVFEDAFSFDVSWQVPNNHDLIFGTEITADQETFNSHIYLKAYAPDISFGNIVMDDGNNGYPEPGETIQVLVNILNSGGGKAYNIESWLTNSDPLVTINQANWSTDILPGNESVTAEFEVYIDGSAPIGHFSQINVHATADHGFSATDVFMFTIGFMVEDFETGNFSNFDWQFDGAAPWFITNQDPHEGNYCMRSGEITDEQMSAAEVTLNVLADGEISFYYKVSSENNYDFLVFSIDGSVQGSWSGNHGWSEVTFPVQAGERTFEWAYEKDYSVSSGSDCAWVDFIVFPPSAPEGLMVFAGPDMTICEDNTATMQAMTANAATIEWATSGDGTFSNPAMLNPEYTPGTDDIASGSANLTLTATDDFGGTLSDDLTLNISLLPDVWAGDDFSVCAGDEAALSGTMEHAASCFWSTSGDGTFAQANQPETVYYPGENDVISGSVVLTLTGEPLLPCNTAGAHSLNLTLHPLPQVTFDELPDLCHNSPAYELTEGAPDGGTYSGPGVVDGWFYPEVAGIGLHILTYTFSDENGCEASADREVFVDECTNLSHIDRLQFQVYPNPGDGKFYVQFGQKISGTFRVEVFNSKGQREFADAVTVNEDAMSRHINLQQLSDGIYYLKVTGSGVSTSAKLIIRK